MDADDAQIVLRPNILPEPLDVLKRLAFGIARKYPYAIFRDSQPDRAKEGSGGGGTDLRTMQTPPLRGGGGLDPDGGFEIELLPTRADVSPGGSRKFNV